MIERPQVGQIAVSTAGRDAGTRYLIVNVLDDRYVEVVDGQKRVWNRPKRKNCRHLLLVGTVGPDLQASLAEGRPLRNAELRSALRAQGAEERQGG
jgi:ribosomal protein L14E/L6E/L27E